MNTIKQVLVPWIYMLGPLAIFPIFDVIILNATQDSVVFTVEKAERVTDVGGEGSRYLIFTKTETFENTDRLVIGKFNSSDLYGTIKANQSYQAKVVGLRVPFLSWYRNIVSIKEK
jgi:hypothetical protein